MAMIAHAPVELPAPPTKKRKPHDYSKLVLRTGRLTRSYWILREAFAQGYRPPWVGPRKHGHYDWRAQICVGQMIHKGYLQLVPGPRGGKDFYQTTEEGAFAMLLAEGQHEAKKQNQLREPA